MSYKNILIAGRTGVGKSSLINYIAGRQVAEIGVGRPKTTRDDITSYEMTCRGVPIRLFDSWGIEADKTEDWKLRTQKMIQDQGDAPQDDSSWFHSIIYCISATTGRVEPIDIEMIRYFRGQSFSVVVALTNADRASDEDMEALEGEIPDGVKVSRVSSGGKTRYETVEPFGIEKLLISIVGTAVDNLPKRTERHFKDIVQRWKDDMLRSLNCKSVSKFSNRDLERWIKSEAEGRAQKLGMEFKAFVADELKTVSTWNRSVADEIPGCSIFIDAKEESELSVGDYIGMTVLAVPFAIFCACVAVFGSEDDERKKLRSKIIDAATKMDEYVANAVLEFAARLNEAVAINNMTHEIRSKSADTLKCETASFSSEDKDPSLFGATHVDVFITCINDPREVTEVLAKELFLTRACARDALLRSPNFTDVPIDVARNLKTTLQNIGVSVNIVPKR